MALGKYIFLSVFVLSLAIVAASYAPAVSQSARTSYMITAAGDTFMWRVNISNGSVSYCRRGDSSIDPGYVAKQTPFCSGGSAPASH